MAVVGEGVGQHHRTAVDHEMDVQIATLLVGRHAHRFAGAERLFVEVGGLAGIADAKIGRDAAQDRGICSSQVDLLGWTCPKDERRGPSPTLSFIFFFAGPRASRPRIMIMMRAWRPSGACECAESGKS